MRSIYLVLESHLNDQISQFLDEYCDDKMYFGSSFRQWTIFCGKDPCITIDNRPLEDNDFFSGDEDIEALTLYLNMNHPVIWSADVSRRRRGIKEVMELADALSARFPICFMDDYTEYLWTSEEIRGDVKIEEHCFFNNQGWFKCC